MEHWYQAEEIFQLCRLLVARRGGKSRGEMRKKANLSQAQLAEMVGVSRNTISSIETGQFNPTAKLALVLCIALEVKFEDLFYFD